MNRQQHVLMQIIQKIDVFDGLTVVDVQNMLAICFLKKYVKGEEVYRLGAPSADMVVLIQGRLQVIGKDGTPLVDIPAGTSIGEMGLFTGEPRSATILASQDSAGLVITRERLEGLMATEKAMKATILQNVVNLLSKRLTDTDHKLEAYMKRVEELEGDG